MSYFNRDQEAYMDYLAKLRPEEKCYCGWYLLGECRNGSCDPNKTNADKIKETPHDPA